MKEWKHDVKHCILEDCIPEPPMYVKESPSELFYGFGPFFYLP